MKKALTLVAACLLMAGSASAATINWGNDTGSKIYDLAGAAITSANIGTYNLVVSLYDASTDTAVVSTSTMASKGGPLTGTAYNYAFDAIHTTGDLFYIVATMTQGGQDYFMYIGSNGIGADAASVTSWAITATDNGGVDTFTWNTGVTYGGAGAWTPVPEPGTAALALAGLALLIRRRK